MTTGLAVMGLGLVVEALTVCAGLAAADHPPIPLDPISLDAND